MKVSILIPVYNESHDIQRVIDRVLAAPMPENVEKEIIVIDDGSTDGTDEILKRYSKEVVKVHYSMLNFGKGTALRVGLKQATGDIIIVQDGDLEYDPAELITLVDPIMKGQAKVVYGSRFMGKIDGMYFRY